MLVLSRRADESVVFPQLGIRLQILRLSAKHARVGIDAPDGVAILRGELAEDAVKQKRHGIGGRNGSPLSQFDLQASQLQSLVTQLQNLAGVCEWKELEPVVSALSREADLIQTKARTRSRSVRESGSKNRMALLVDDNNNENRLLASYLKLKKFDVATAENGAQAIDYLSQHGNPDFMLLDMNMPEYDGRWTVNQIRKTPRLAGMKVFAISGYDPAEYGVELGELGVNRWFQKPLNPEELVRELLKEQSGSTPVMAG